MRPVGRAAKILDPEILHAPRVGRWMPRRRGAGAVEGRDGLHRVSDGTLVRAATRAGIRRRIRCFTGFARAAGRGCPLSGGLEQLAKLPHLARRARRRRPRTRRPSAATVDVPRFARVEGTPERGRRVAGVATVQGIGGHAHQPGHLMAPAFRHRRSK